MNAVLSFGSLVTLELYIEHRFRHRLTGITGWALKDVVWLFNLINDTQWQGSCKLKVKEKTRLCRWNQQLWSGGHWPEDVRRNCQRDLWLKRYIPFQFLTICVWAILVRVVFLSSLHVSNEMMGNAQEEDEPVEWRCSNCAWLWSSEYGCQQQISFAFFFRNFKRFLCSS